MQPVEPVATVRGPAALAKSRITSADSQPWQVRWPEVYISSSGACRIVLILSNWTSVAIARSSGLLAHADPGDEPVEVVRLGRLLGDLEHLDRVGDRYVAAAQSRDEVYNRRAVARRVQARADLVQQRPAVVRRAVREVAVDHAHGLEAAEASAQLDRGERPEPAQVDVADLVALLAQAAHRRAARGGHGAHADQHHLGVVGHVLVEERGRVPLAEDGVELAVRLQDHRAGAPRGLPVLAPQLHHPVLVGLRGDGDRVIGVQHAVAQVVRRQEALDRLRAGDPHDVLGMGEERAVHRQRARHAHARVLGDAVAEQHVLQRLLRGGHPEQQPAHVAHGQRVVVLHAERAGVVQRAVADQEQHGQAVGGGDHQRLEAVGPAGAAGTGEGAGADRAGVLDDLELAVLAVGDDVLGVELAVGDQLRDLVHHLRVGADGVCRDYVHVGQPHTVGHGLTAGEQLLGLVDRDGLRCSHCALSPRGCAPTTCSPAPQLVSGARGHGLLHDHALRLRRARDVRAVHRLALALGHPPPLAVLHAGARHERVPHAAVALLLLRPGDVARLVALVVLPGALVVLELQLVDHHDALFDRAHLRAAAAADAVLVVDVVQAVRGRVEALVGAVVPAQLALGAQVEAHHRALRAGGEALELLIARLAVGTDLEVPRHRLHHDALAELVPLRQLGDGVRPADPLARRHGPLLAAHLVIRRPRRLHTALVVGLIAQIPLDRLDADQRGVDRRQRAEHPLAREVVLVHPQAGEAGVATQDRQVPGERLALDPLEQLLGLAPRDDQHGAALDELLVDRADAVPGPRLDPLDHRVVEHDGDVRLVDVQLGAALRLQLLLVEVGGDEREVLTGDAVALGGVAVATVGEPGLAHAAGDQDDVAADIFGQVLLKDAAVLDLDPLDGGHARSSSRHLWAPRLDRWSDQY